MLDYIKDYNDILEGVVSAICQLSEVVACYIHRLLHVDHTLQIHPLARTAVTILTIPYQVFC